MEGDSGNDSEVRILATLTTNGRHPLELCFVVEGGIRRWHPKSGLVAAHIIEDREYAKACKAYLRSKGLGFKTWDEVAEWARLHNWPALEQLQSQVEGIKRSRSSS